MNNSSQVLQTTKTSIVKKFHVSTLAQIVVAFIHTFMFIKDGISHRVLKFPRNKTKI